MTSQPSPPAVSMNGIAADTRSRQSAMPLPLRGSPLPILKVTGQALTFRCLEKSRSCRRRRLC